MKNQTADSILLAASVSMFFLAVGSFATGQQAALLWLGVLAVIIFAVNKIKSRMKRIGIKWNINICSGLLRMAEKSSKPQ